MKKIVLIKLFLSVVTLVSGQNLIPNGDFELKIGCPNNISQIDSALFWSNPSNIGTPDYFHQCASFLLVGVPNNLAFLGGSYQVAKSGVAYGGVILFDNSQSNYREYIETPLISSLVQNVTYHFEMYISLVDFSELNTYNIGVYFSDTIIEGITNFNNLPYIPQIFNVSGNYPDTSNWKFVSGNYTAMGGENYLIIGNFNNDLNTNVISTGTSSGWEWAYIYIDDVTLAPLTSSNTIDSKLMYNIYPNPVYNLLNIENKTNLNLELIVYDTNLKEVKHIYFNTSTSIYIEDLSDGVYFYSMRNNKFIHHGKFIKTNIIH